MELMTEKGCDQLRKNERNLSNQLTKDAIVIYKTILSFENHNIELREIYA